MSGLKILAVESSAVCASAAVCDNGRVTGECFVNAGLTHSQTLMPLVKNCMDTAGVTLDDIDLLAVAHGPGSFTGVRIGIAAVKGIAFGGKKCCGISTLEAMAYNLKGLDCVALCAMDARCSQVYMALFDCGDEVTRLCEDKAVMISELPELIKNYKKDVYILGDGAELCYNYLKTICNNGYLAPALCRYQRASSVAVAAYCGAGECTDADKLTPVYLRVPQAERELKKKRSDNE